MYRQFIQLFITIIFFTNIDAQNNGVVVDGKWGNKILITDVNGKSFENKYDDVVGNPFFTPEFKYAKIVLQQGRTLLSIKTRLNLVLQQVNFISANDVEYYLESLDVKEISYADTSSFGIQQYTFKTGFPPIDKLGVNHLYQILVEGNCSLIKSVIKKIEERKNAFSGEIVKEFETSENYYLFKNGKMKRLQKTKDFFLMEFADKQIQVKQFMLDNKINFKNIEHLIQLLNFYNQ